MFRRELRLHRKWFLLCTLALTLLLAGGALVFSPRFGTIAGDQAATAAGAVGDRLRAVLPYGIADGEPEGWLTAGGMALLLPAGALYAALLGSAMLSKETDGGTAETILSLPVSRADLVLSHYAAGLVYILLLTAIVGAATCLVIRLTGELQPTDWQMFVCAGLVFAAVYSICVFVSSLCRRTGVAMCIGSAFAVAAYILAILGQARESASWMAKVSVFSLCDVRAILGRRPDLARRVATGCLLCAGSAVLAVWVYKWRDLA